MIKEFTVKSLSFRPQFARHLERLNDHLEVEIKQYVGITALVTAMLEVVIQDKDLYNEAKERIKVIKQKKIMNLKKNREVFK